MNLENIVKQINTWYPKNNLPIPINQPTINEKDINSITDTLNENWVSTAGPIINEFEEQLKSEFDQKEVVAVNSGTSALHLSLLGLGISQDDQIITTPLTFVAPSPIAGTIPTPTRSVPPVSTWSKFIFYAKVKFFL